MVLLLLPILVILYLVYLSLVSVVVVDLRDVRGLQIQEVKVRLWMYAVFYRGRLAGEMVGLIIGMSV